MILEDARVVPAPGGSGLACRFPGVVLYCAEAEPADAVGDLVGRCRAAAMAEEPGVVLVRQLASLIATAGREALPSFAVVASSSQGLAVLVAGQLEVDVELGDRHEHLSGATSITYVDRLVPGDATAISVHRPGEQLADARPDLDLIQGVVAAGGLRLDARAVVTSSPPDPAPPAAFQTDPGSAEPAPPPQPVAPHEPAAAEPPAEPIAPPEPPAAEPAPLAPPATPPAPAPAAAVDPRPAPPAPAPASAPPPPPPPAPTPPPPPSPAPAPPPPADFDFVQLNARAASPTDEPLPLPPLPTEPDPAEVRDAESDTSQVRVRGTICSRGHFNDPRSRFCSSCGISMVQQTLNLVSGVRPPLGVLVFEDGTTYSLSANYVVGRQPEMSPLIQSGNALPLLLEDTGKTISRVHAELRLEEWDVYFVNLSATNGSYVFDRQSAQWQGMPNGQAVKLAPGTRVAMGGRVAVFESALVR